jgi:predicted ester cyclase
MGPGKAVPSRSGTPAVRVGGAEKQHPVRYNVGDSRGNPDVKLYTLPLFVVIVTALTAAGPVAAHAQETTGQNPPTAQAPIAAGQDSPASPAQTASKVAETHPVDWAPLQYVEMWNTGKTDADIQNSIFNNSVIMHSRGMRLFLSPGMVGGVIRSWRNSMPDLKFTIEDKIIQGDKVVLRLTFSGTFTKVLWANTLEPEDFNPPKKIHSDEILIFHVKNGKIDEIWEEYNEVWMRFQMGSKWSGKPPSTNSGASPAAAPPAPPPVKP